MKPFSKIFGRIITLFTVLIIIGTALFTVPKFLGYIPFIVQSGSMEPVINTGAVAFINTNDTDVTTGDIITYELPVAGEQVLVTHRVVEVLDDGNILTKGDANDAADLAPISKNQIIGTYAMQIPYAGFIMTKLDQKAMLIALLWIILLNGISLVLSNLAEKEDAEIVESENRENTENS